MEWPACLPPEGGGGVSLSATFREGIDTPIDLALLDNRITNKKEAILVGNKSLGIYLICQ